MSIINKQHPVCKIVLGRKILILYNGVIGKVQQMEIRYIENSDDRLDIIKILKKEFDFELMDIAAEALEFKYQNEA